MNKKLTIENEESIIEKQEESSEQANISPLEPTQGQIIDSAERTDGHGQDVSLIDGKKVKTNDLWESLGTDSTAVIDVVVLNTDDIQPCQNTEIGAWLEKSKEEKVDLDEKIHSGIELARTEAANYNKLIHVTGKSLGERGILQGTIYNRLKKLSRNSGMLWGVWAEKNLPFISKRNREKFMLLAKRKDCHQYAFLGVDRLELLCSATKDSKDNNPIGELLGKYQISFDDKSEVNLVEFKLSIDSALNNEKLLRNGITADLDVIKNLTQIGTEFDKSFVKKLKDIQDCGGNPQTYLGKLSMNRGGEPLESEDEKRLQDFNTLSNRLIKTIDFLIEDEDYIEMIDKKTLDILFEKLTKLRGATTVTAMQQAA